MNWIDLVILAIIGISVAISLWRGFTREALSLAGWIVAFWVGINFADRLQWMLESQISVPSARLVVSFAILFLITLVLATLVNNLVVELIQRTGLSGTDRMIGIFFGVLRGCLVVAILVLLGGLTPLPHDPWWHESSLLHYFQDIAMWVRDYLPSGIASSIRYG